MPGPIGSTTLAGVRSTIFINVGLSPNSNLQNNRPDILDDPAVLASFLNNLRGCDSPRSLSVFGSTQGIGRRGRVKMNDGVQCAEASYERYVPISENTTLDVGGDRIPLNIGDIVDKKGDQITFVRLCSDRKVVLRGGVEVVCSRDLPLTIAPSGLNMMRVAAPVTLPITDIINVTIMPHYKVERNQEGNVTAFYRSTLKINEGCEVNILDVRLLVSGMTLLQDVNFYFTISGNCNFSAGKNGSLVLKNGDSIKVSPELNVVSVKSAQPQRIPCPNGMVVNLPHADTTEFIVWKGCAVPRFAVLLEDFAIPAEEAIFRRGSRVCFEPDGSYEVLLEDEQNNLVYGVPVETFKTVTCNADGSIRNIR